MKLEINVAGAEVAVEAVPRQPLRRVRNEAFAAAGLWGQPPENWEMRDQDGRLLDADQLVSTFEFTDSTRLFLSQKPGVGA